MRSKSWVRCWGIIALFQTCIIILASASASPAQEQLSLLRDLNLPTPSILNQNQDNQTTSACILTQWTLFI